MTRQTGLKASGGHKAIACNTSLHGASGTGGHFEESLSIDR